MFLQAHYYLDVVLPVASKHILSYGMPMRKILLIALVFWFFHSVALAQQPDIDFGPAHDLQIISANQTILLSVELADDPDERAQGLMMRTEMADTAGMLFDFKRMQIVNMWMKNTLIPLDMIFLDEQGKIVTIARNTKPGSLRRISSAVPVIAVLEVNAGLSRKWQLQRGDQIVHKMFQNQQEEITEDTPDSAILLPE